MENVNIATQSVLQIETSSQQQLIGMEQIELAMEGINEASAQNVEQLHEDIDLALQTVRDHLDDDVETVITDSESNYNEIYKNKLHEIRKGIEGFNLKIEEIANILKYLNSTYFPYIKLYYDFCNRTRVIENKKIDIIINRPTLIPPLNVAKEIKEEVKKKEEEIDNKTIINVEILFIMICFYESKF